MKAYNCESQSLIIVNRIQEETHDFSRKTGFLKKNHVQRNPPDFHGKKQDSYRKKQDFHAKNNFS
jgi:hypothetical protein